MKTNRSRPQASSCHAALPANTPQPLHVCPYLALHISPYADTPGHTLVIPTAHSLGVIDAPPADLAAAMALVQRMGRAMQTALGATGIVVLNASGPDSGQSVAHLHFHVVPCWADDEVTFWPASRSRHQLGAAHELLADALAGKLTARTPPQGQPS